MCKMALKLLFSIATVLSCPTSLAAHLYMYVNTKQVKIHKLRAACLDEQITYRSLEGTCIADVCVCKQIPLCLSYMISQGYC